MVLAAACLRGDSDCTHPHLHRRSRHPTLHCARTAWVLSSARSLLNTWPLRETSRLMAGEVRKRAELVELYFVQKIRMVDRLTQSEQPHRSK